MKQEEVMQLIISAKDQASKTLDKVTSKVDLFSRKADDFTRSGLAIAQPLAGATTSLLKLEAAMLAGGAAMTAFALKVSGDFDTAFREIATLVDQPIGNLTAFKQEILDYASSSTQSLDQVTAAIYGAISSGTDYSSSLSLVRQSEQLAVASKASLQESLVLLASSMNAYGADADSAAKYSDALFTTVKQGQTTLPELAASLAQVTGIAAGAGVPFETLLSAVAALTSAGAPTSQAVTQIKAAISNIIKPSKAAAETAAALGIQFDATALQSLGLEGVLGSVQRATGGNVETMAKLFGSTEALNAVISLTGTGAQKFAETLTVMKNATGSTSEAFDKMANSIGLGQQKIENSLKGLLISVGTPLLDEFGGMQQAIAAMFQAMQDSLNIGTLGQFTVELEDLARGAQKTFEAIATNLPEALGNADYQPILEGIDAVRNAVVGLFDGADLTSADGLTRAINIMGGAFNTLSVFTATTIETLTPLMSLLGGITEAFAELDPEIIKTVATIGGISLVVVPALSAIGSLVTIVSAATTVFGGMGVAALGVSAPILGTVAAVGAAVVAVGSLVSTVIGWNEATVEAGLAEDRAASSAENLTQRYAEISKQVGITIVDSKHFHQLIKEGAIVADQASGGWIAAGEAQRDFAAEVEAAKEASYDWNEAIKGMVDEQGNLKGVVTKTTKAIDDTGQAAIDAAAAYYEFIGNSPALARRMAELAAKDGPVAALTGQLNTARESSEQLRMSLEQMASDERIKVMEFTVDFGIAKVQADANKFKALMETVAVSVQSTGETLLGLGDLYIEASNGPSLSVRDKIEDQMDAESTRRDRLIDSQVNYFDAKTERVAVKTEALRKGESLITISGDGLAPELEAFMFKVLESIQIRASEENAEFLLGI